MRKVDELMEILASGTEGKPISGRKVRGGVLEDEVVRKKVEERLFLEEITRVRVVSDDTHDMPDKPFLDQRFVLERLGSRPEARRDDASRADMRLKDGEESGLQSLGRMPINGVIKGLFLGVSDELVLDRIEYNNDAAWFWF